MSEPGSAAATMGWLPEHSDLELRPTELLRLHIDGELTALQVLWQRLCQLLLVVDALAGRFAASGRIICTVADARDEGTPMAAPVDLAVEVPAGPDLLAGSARLKAGSTQKAVINGQLALVMACTGLTSFHRIVDLHTSEGRATSPGAPHRCAATAIDMATAARGGAGGAHPLRRLGPRGR